MSGAMTTLTLPRLAGTRAAGAEFAALAGFGETQVVLDFTENLSTAQGYCDEVVKNLTDRGIRITEIIGANDRVRGYLELAYRLRGLGVPAFAAAHEILDA